MIVVKTSEAVTTIAPLLRDARTTCENIGGAFFEIAKSIVAVALIIGVAEVAAIALILG